MLCVHNWHLFKCNRASTSLSYFISAQKLCFSSCCLFFVWTLLDSGCWVLVSNIDATKWREKETGAYTAAQCSLGAITVKYGRDAQSQDSIEFFVRTGDSLCTLVWFAIGGALIIRGLCFIQLQSDCLFFVKFFFFFSAVFDPRFFFWNIETHTYFVRLNMIVLPSIEPI